MLPTPPSRRPIRSASLALAAAGVWVAAVAPAAARAQEPPAPPGVTVRSARMVAALGPDGGEARVRVEYVLDGLAAGDTVGASALAFGSAAASGLVSAGRPATLRPVQGAASATTLTAEPGPEPGTTVVRVAYTVPAAVTDGRWGLRGYVPVVTVDHPPAEARPGLFRAELLLPDSWAVSDAFPTGLRAEGEAATAPEGEAATAPEGTAATAAGGASGDATTGAGDAGRGATGPVGTDGSAPPAGGTGSAASSGEPAGAATGSVPRGSASPASPPGLGSTDGARRWVVELPVIPAVVSFRAHPDLAWHPGLSLILDLLVGGVLLVLGVFGWRHLRRLAG